MNRKEFLKMTAGLAGGVAGLPLMRKLAGAATAEPGLPGTVGAISAAAAARTTSAPFETLLAQAAAAGDDDHFWKLVRGQFLLDPGWIYLNFGGLGSCPLPVLNRLIECTQAEERAPSAGHDEKPWQDVKEKLARALGQTCRKEDLGLIGGATEGVSVIVNGLALKKGDEVITTTHEHVAVHSALLNRMQRNGIAIRLFEPDIVSGLGNVDRIAKLITPRTRLIFISHVTCTTGQLFPVKEIAAMARSKNVWFALDGAQAPICVPFDIVETGVDFYTCSTHKWMMGPKRTGFIYVRPGMLDTLRPQTVGGGSSERYDAAKGEFVFHPTAQRYESGTQNDALFYALGAACDFVETISADRIWRHNRSLAERFYQELGQIPGVERLSPEEEAYRTAMIGFRMKSHAHTQIGEHMAKDKIRVRPVTEGGLNSIRVSFHINNHDGDVTAILESLKKLARPDLNRFLTKY
ncbi:MAG TPA: aminotransferase class V-fold PLP-dependent enzyme [Phycisphaerae bacterium]|nr:aminotransferase class V-fold PLP-dependent enzyme [Phycisphaerae bacterium]